MDGRHGAGPATRPGGTGDAAATDPAPTVAALERASLTAVPAPLEAFDGPFVVRAFAGGTGRANATCSLDPAPDDALAARVARIESRYAARGLPARFRSTPLDPPGLADLLRARGYREDGPTLVMTGPLGGGAPDAPAAPRRDPAVSVLEGPDAPWLAVLGTAEHQVPARLEEKRRGAGMMLVPAAWLLLREAGEPAACAMLVADGELAGIFDLAVSPRFRRRGLAQRVLGAGAAWAAALGACRWWLQVAADNAPAVALYEALGLRERYRYRYFLRD
ncbi:GNAT family N-acetyltransferase [Roseomonas sp. NAR14]|uniref:GNAT family N-acetyltransferase n=1 Tax=Roseomonas acroporae TaxID=2937791 RepID=A0A9X1Y566_9PROT|nr:GNAT family N-acetyltransferase [Roseomonas acroporae]MCK8783503.1 GNAT family N-acetyltransferase [Roseomonas acroporae]